ncbi:uncharacterized protein [Rhodnius prolixus]|uniref:uncharacterized protein n=1 Tax=Rhodnius prolixus TaxID=13249 RepID=UPI003D18DD56
MASKTSFLIFTFTLAVVFSVCLAQDESCRSPPAGWPRRPPQCCDIPFPLESMKRQFGSCVRQIGRPSSAVPTAKAVMEARYCIEECVYKGMGLLDESGTALNHQRLTQELNRAVTGAGLWESAMQQAITSCSGATGQGSDDSSCSEIPHAFTHCLMRQLFLNCPADKWNNSAECNLVKDRMQVCPNIPPPPPIPPQQRSQQQNFQP